MKKIFLEDCCDILDSMRVPITAKDRKSGIYPYYGANGLQDYVSDYIFDDELVLLSEDGGHFNSKEHPIAYRVSGKCWVNNHAHVLKPKSGIDVDYLCYTLMFYDVSKMINGTTRKKLNQSSMRKMLIPIVNYNEQLAIVYRLKIIENLIDNRQQQLNLLDELIKSRFIEMFGEEDYLNDKLKNVSTKITDGTHQTPIYQKSGIPFVSAKNIIDGKLNFDDIKYITNEEYKSIQNRCQIEENDLLLTKSGSLGMSAIVDINFNFGIFESLAVIKYNRDKLNGLFLREQIKTDKIQTQLKYGVKGIAIKHLHLNVIGNINIIVPPIELQNKFAAFVEQVEKTKKSIKKSLDELNLLKNSLMQKYFG